MKTRLRQRFPSTRILLLSLFIAAIGFGCGGGGGGGGGGAPATYTVGGSVSGLGNTGLVLQNNAGNDLSISADGAFSFSTTLASNIAYAVTVQTQPVGQTCAVTNGTGSVANANITNINVSCAFGQQNAQGLYTNNGASSGTFKNADLTKPDVVEALSDIKGMVYGALPKQEFIFFDVKTNVLYHGNITSITLNTFSGTATVYHDGVMVDNSVKVSGTVTTRSSIDMTLAASGNFVGGSIKGLFSTEYDKAATKARALSDTGLGYKSFQGPIIMVAAGMQTPNFEVFNNASYSMYSSKNASIFQCVHNGTALSNKFKDIYTLSESLGDPNCPIPSSSRTNYAGFASVVDGLSIDSRLWYAVTNGAYSIFGILNKQ